MSQVPAAYATDEDVALLAPGDFAMLCPADQLVTAGADGAFAAVDLWALTSSTAGLYNLVAGQVVRLDQPSDVYPAPGALFGVAYGSSSFARLRRLGLTTGQGAPPAPVGGVTGVRFVAATLGPQLERASRELDRLLGLDPAVPGRSPAELDDLDPLRDAVVRLVLARRYLMSSRDGSTDAFAVKGRALKVEFDALIARLILRFNAGDPGTAPRFGTRVVR